MSAYSAAVLADSPSLYYRLGETSGSTVADSSGNSKTGTCNGTLAPVAGALLFDPDGALNFASSFYLSFTAFLLQTNWAVEAWIMAHGTLQASDVLLGAAGTNTFNFNGNRLRASVNGSDIVIAPSAPPVGVWQHWVFSIISSAWTLYCNGASVVTGSSSSGLNCEYVGGSPPNSYTAGSNFSLDEFALYPAGLSAARVLAHYDEGISTGRAGFF